MLAPHSTVVDYKKMQAKPDERDATIKRLKACRCYMENVVFLAGEVVASAKDPARVPDRGAPNRFKLGELETALGSLAEYRRSQQENKR